MAYGTNIRTYFERQWHDGDIYIMRAADHGSWLGSSVFDGARSVAGMTPDLDAHCQRLNDSAMAMGITPTVSTEEMVEIAREGLEKYSSDAAVYIRPMYWGIDCGHMAIVPGTDRTGFSICLEEAPMPPPGQTLTLTRTRFHRPVLATALVNAKAGCLYPNNSRMLSEARSKGFANALVADALGNVAETATSNIFMVRDGVVQTPVENGTFLAGITRRRVIDLLRQDGCTVEETVLTFEDFHAASEVFSTGNMAKVLPVSRFDDTGYQSGTVASRAREIYWDWARNQN